MASAGIALRIPASPAFRSSILHFAGGVVFAVVAGEFVPELLRDRALWSSGIGFALGTAAMLGLKRLTETESEDPGNASPVSLLAGIGLDVLIDGLMLGIAFASAYRQGVLLSISMILEGIPLGLAMAAALAARKRFGAGRILGCAAAVAAGFPVGAFLAALLLAAVPALPLSGVLGFGTAALLFLVTEELLSEAHDEPDTPLRTAFFFAGFLMIFLMEMAG